MKGGIPWQSNDKLWASTSGGHRFDPWSGELRSHMPWGTTEKRKEKRKTEKKKSGTSASGQISLFRIESHDRHSESVVCKPGSLFYDCWWKIIKPQTVPVLCSQFWLLRAGHRDRLFQFHWNVAVFTGFCIIFGCFVMQWESWRVVMGMTWPAELKIPTFQPFTETLLTPAPREGFLGGLPAARRLPVAWPPVSLAHLPLQCGGHCRTLGVGAWQSLAWPHCCWFIPLYHFPFYYPSVSPGQVKWTWANILSYTLTY